jgi:hypothetical protein
MQGASKRNSQCCNHPVVEPGGIESPRKKCFARARLRFLGLPLFVASLLLAGCASVSSSPSATSGGGVPLAPHITSLPTVTHCGALTKLKIVTHLGIAYYAFQHYLYAPWKSGQFHARAHKRTTAIVKGVIAGLVGIHEFRTAVGDLHQCGTGQRTLALLSTAQSQLTGLRSSANANAANSRINSQMKSLTRTYNQLQTAA